jgi:hypothetical protein
MLDPPPSTKRQISAPPKLERYRRQWSTPGSDPAKVVLPGEVLKLGWRGSTPRYVSRWGKRGASIFFEPPAGGHRYTSRDHAGRAYCRGTDPLAPCMKAWISSRVRRPSLLASIALKIRS